MKFMEELEDMLCDELKEITNKGKVTANDLEAIDKLTHSIKSIETIMAMEEGYSNDSYSMRGSYARRRDSMGRYSREDGYSRGGRNYSYDKGRDGMLEELQDMMEDAESEKEREAIRHCMSQIKM